MFSSITAHNGYVTLKDDLISIAYMLIYLYYGSLPWTILKINNHKEELVQSIKRNVDFLQFFCDFHDLTRESIKINPIFRFYHNIIHQSDEKEIDYEGLCLSLDPLYKEKKFSFLGHRTN